MVNEKDLAADSMEGGDENKQRSNALRKAYGSATARLREQYRAEFDSLYAQEAKALGVDHTPRLTPEQKAEKELADLLDRHPHLRSKLTAA